MGTSTLCLPEMKVDQAWHSEFCKNTILSEIVRKYPCKQRFVRVDVMPLYADDPYRYYRVVLWVNDWSTETFGPTKEIWRTFHVILEGADRKIISIEADRKKKLAIGENGMKFMKELGINQEKV